MMMEESEAARESDRRERERGDAWLKSVMNSEMMVVARSNDAMGWYLRLCFALPLLVGTKAITGGNENYY